MNDKLLVNEIFDSIDGEGKTAGQLATFIRLCGCNLRCSYCDTTYAFTEGRPMAVEDIVCRVSYPHVTVTGGEPLCQDIHTLLQKLQGHSVNIETNGSMDITPYFVYPHVWFTVDYKSTSSQMADKMLAKNFSQLRKQDVLKFVVGSLEDLQQAWDICRTYQPVCPVYVGPVYGNIEAAQIVDFMKQHELTSWKLQLQLHKYIWDPNQRGV